MGVKRVWSTTGVAALTGALLLTSAPLASADEVRDRQWPLTVYDTANVWDKSRGKGVTVAVVDSGVDASHPDLQGQVLPGKDFSRPSLGAHKDNDGHGTGMASIIAGKGHGSGNRSGVVGIAPEAKILPVRAFKDDKDAMDWTWPDGIRYAVDQGADVINLSFKESNQSAGTKGAKAIAYAQAHDVVVVAGVGNDGGTVSSLAALPGVVGATAVDEKLKLWGDANTGEGVVLAAPGVNIPSADPTSSSGYTVASGTSDATAYVSGIAALLRSKFPDLTAGQIINRMVKSADYLGNTPDKETLGYGIARPGTALKMDIPKGPKEGPLAKAPSGAESKGAPAEGDDSSSSDTAGKKKKSSSSGLLIGVGIGVGVLIIVGVVFAVMRSRGNRGNGGPGNGGPGGPGGPSGYPGQQQYPHAAPPGQGYPAPPGQAPQQGGPYGPQQ